MWYFIKQSLMALIYLFFSAIMGFGILCIGDHLIWLKVILMVLNVGLYAVVVGAGAFSDGQVALRVRIANDLEREHIILTGEDRPLKLTEEFKPWKGFIFGLIACIPLIIMLIVHTFLFIFAGEAYNGAGAIAGIFYIVAFGFFRVNTAVAVTMGMYYYSLFAIPIIMLITGIPYMLGGRKIELQQERIKERQRMIYGGKR